MGRIAIRRTPRGQGLEPKTTLMMADLKDRAKLRGRDRGEIAAAIRLTWSKLLRLCPASHRICSSRMHYLNRRTLTKIATAEHLCEVDRRRLIPPAMVTLVEVCSQSI
jgi:hypothetical protein